MVAARLYPAALLLTLGSVTTFAFQGWPARDQREPEKSHQTGPAKERFDRERDRDREKDHRDGDHDNRRVVFSHPPANLDQVSAVIPLGNVNAVAGGHVRPVNHMYLQYLVPAGGGTASVDVDAMADGRIVGVLQRQTCVTPDLTAPGGCAGAPIDEYQIFIQHHEQVTVYYDHLHSLDPRLHVPDWRDDSAGWVRLGPPGNVTSLLFPGLNGARHPVEVHAGQRVGATRNYFTTWDIGVIDTRHDGAFLGSGLLRYPSFHEMVLAMIDAGLATFTLGPDDPFPGGMFVNATRFIDDMTPPLGAAWRAKLLGDGTGGRDDWDVLDSLQGNWYRADVTAPTLENIFATEENALSFSPYNLDPTHQVKIGVGDSFFSHVLVSPPALIVEAARDRLARLTHGLLFTPDRVPGHTPATFSNPDPLAVRTGDYACYDVPDPEGGPGHPLRDDSLLVYLTVESGVVHLKLRYVHASASPTAPGLCATLLTNIGSGTLSLSGPWWGDYVR